MGEFCILNFNENQPIGATPLDKNELSGLKHTHISFLTELNEFESLNILAANNWLKSNKKRDVLSISFLVLLHKKMFGDVWSWAGKFRTSDKNIGVPWFQIAEKTECLLQDTKHWIENKTFPWTEIGARLHHRLVFIHPFPNGNGRHARLFCDALFAKQNIKLLTWGSISNEPAKQRTQYIAALQAADAKNYEPLIHFLSN